MAEYSILHLHHNFIHSFTDGHKYLLWNIINFHVLAIANDAAMNMGYTCIFKLVFTFLDTFPKAELPDHMVMLFLNFEDSPYCFLQQLNYYAVPPTGHMGILFSNNPCLHRPSWAPGLSEFFHHGLQWGMGVSWWWFLSVLEQNQCNIADCIIFQGVPVQTAC